MCKFGTKIKSYFCTAKKTDNKYNRWRVGIMCLCFDLHVVVEEAIIEVLYSVFERIVVGSENLKKDGIVNNILL